MAQHAKGATIHLTLVGYLVALAAVVAGSTVQATIGFGASLVAVPVIAIVVPGAVPAATTLLTLPLTLSMAAREHDHVDWPGVRWLTLGLLPGTALGAAVVATVATDTLLVVTGVSVLAAVALTAASASLPMSPATTAATGLVSGTMSTTTSIGGPPLALLYQHHEGRVVRSTLAVTFAAATVISLIGLLAARAVAGWQMLLSLALAPGVVAGLLIGRVTARRLDGRRLRPIVLVFVAVTALAAIARGLA